MRTLRKLAAVATALVAMSSGAAAQSKVTIAVGGASCLCYLPTVLTQQLAISKRRVSPSRSLISREGRRRSRQSSAAARMSCRAISIIDRIGRQAAGTAVLRHL